MTNLTLRLIKRGARISTFTAIAAALGLNNKAGISWPWAMLLTALISGLMAVADKFLRDISSEIK